MTKPTEPQRKILDKLLYPEPFEKVHEETGLDYGVLRDELISLINFGYIVAYESEGGTEANIHFYDNDNLDLFTFKATKQGLTALRM
jgi:hypothetical protein